MAYLSTYRAYVRFTDGTETAWNGLKRNGAIIGFSAIQITAINLTESNSRNSAGLVNSRPNRSSFNIGI
jgi:hypothetical protein